MWTTTAAKMKITMNDEQFPISRIRCSLVVFGSFVFMRKRTKNRTGIRNNLNVIIEGRDQDSRGLSSCDPGMRNRSIIVDTTSKMVKLTNVKKNHFLNSISGIDMNRLPDRDRPLDNSPGSEYSLYIHSAGRVPVDRDPEIAPTRWNHVYPDLFPVHQVRDTNESSEGQLRMVKRLKINFLTIASSGNRHFDTIYRLSQNP